jgi:argonaute-like protein
MDSKYQIKLNFLAIAGSLPGFSIYRAPRSEIAQKPEGEVFGFSLPINRDGKERAQYWVRFSPDTGFEEFHVSPNDNNFLTVRALFTGLHNSARALLQEAEFEAPKKSFIEELSFNFKQYAEGREQLTVQPYFLKDRQLFGWLTDFRFRMEEGVAFSRRIQQLSLSLDANYRRNLDYYLDRTNRLNEMLAARLPVLDGVMLPGLTQPIKAEPDFTSISATRLQSKTYLFAGDRESRSQFTGLRQYGPLEPLSAPPKILFAFRERDRQSARTLAIALQGSKKQERYSFPGFESLFKSPISIDGNPIILPDLTPESFSAALQRVKSERISQPSIIPVFVLPEGDDNGYMQHKAIFTHEGIPTQVCTLSIIDDEYALKWAIANIALQIFCKGGGKPWKVRPSPERTLIIGISQSHKTSSIGEHTKVDKYFAFSVMSDNSGLFQQLRVLGDSDDESQYLDELKKNLHAILAERSAEFSQVVVHTSFRLKHKEMEAIEDTVKKAAAIAKHSCRFAVVKVNHRNRFFGINPDVNSLVPFEGTVARLGGGEHLVWFEGIFPEKKTVTKAFPGPTHVSFLRVSDTDNIADESLLQDLINLSGANWRGFNAKSAPVSVFYCHLVADLVHDFQQQGLPLPKVQDLRPWFL